MTSGKMIEYKTSTGKGTGYLASPRGSSRGSVLVLHAWWGLNDVFKRTCDRLADDGYIALAPDLFGGHVNKTVDEAKTHLSQYDEGKIAPPIVLGALDYLHALTSAGKRPIGVVGFSMGAAWALWLSEQRPADVAAVVTFYGTYTGLDFSKSHASYLGHYSPVDEWEPMPQIKLMEENIRSAGRPVEFHVYPDTKHWFFEENRPEYNAKEASLAWTRTLQFLGHNLK